MKFKVKLINKTDPSKFIEEDTFAASKKELEELYKLMYPDFSLNILAQENDPGPPPAPKPVPLPLAPSKNPIAPAKVQPTIKTPKEVFFEDNGCEYKVVDNVIHKKVWVDVDPNIYRILNSKNLKVVSNEKYVIQTLDWVCVATPLKDEIQTKENEK